MTTTYCNADDFLAYIRQYDYHVMLDTDGDGNADSTQSTFHIEQGARKLNHYNTNFSDDSKFAANLAFAAVSLYGSPKFAGSVPGGVQDDYDYWLEQCEKYNAVATSPSQMYDPAEQPTQEYMDSLLEDPQ